MRDTEKHGSDVNVNTIYRGYCDWNGRQHIYIRYVDQDGKGFTEKCFLCRSNVRHNYPPNEVVE